MNDIFLFLRKKEKEKREIFFREERNGRTKERKKEVVYFYLYC